MKGKESLIIRYLIENKDKELNILKISKAVNMDYKNVHSIVKRIHNRGLLNIEKFGRSNRIKLINKIHPLIFKAEYERMEDILKNRNLAVMLSNFKSSISSRFYTLLLFGSYAKKKQTKNSDIDLIFICPDGSEEKFEKDVNRISRSMPLPIHPLVFSQGQFIGMINAKGPNVGKEALSNNIILYSVEPYYKMISND